MEVPNDMDDNVRGAVGGGGTAEETAEEVERRRLRAEFAGRLAEAERRGTVRSWL